MTKHAGSEQHQLAMTKWMDNIASTHKKTSIIHQLDDAHNKYVSRNREYMKVLIETLVFTAQQNIAQRGHVEARNSLECISDENRGNFLELLHLRCKDIPWLAEKLNTQLKNSAQWTSPDIQNEILTIVAEQIRDRIATDVRKSEIFGVIMDETSDVSKIEQVSVCISFVIDGVKKETFIGFYATKSTEGEVLYELIQDAVKELKLDMANIVGEGFDGASNMSGKHNGVAARMKECSPLALYVHCYGHRLNLALQDAMTAVEPLRNALGTINGLYNFLEASPKRHALFTDTEVEGEHLVLTLKSLSVTRWSCRWEAVRAVWEQMGRIVKALITLTSDRDPKTYAESRALLNAVCDFEFIFGLCLLKIILSNTNALCKYLQGKKMDVICAKQTADLTMKTLSKCRNEESFNNTWELASNLGKRMEMWIQDTAFSVKEARVPRHKPSRR